MKIIQIADLHLDSKMETYLSRDKAKERKLELRQTFSSVIDYAKENGVSVVMICGDMFDSENITLQTKNFIYNIVLNNPQIDFLVLKGNHDEYMFEDRDTLPNLKFFSNDFKYFSYGSVAISGLNFNDKYQKNIFDLLKFNADKINILCLHGQVTNYSNDALDYPIPLNELKNLNIDFLALGHIHSFAYGQIDERGMYAYSGILEPRGFDECGQKGFIEIEIKDEALTELTHYPNSLTLANGKMNVRFVPFSKRQFHIVNVNIESATNAFDVQMQVTNALNGISSGDLIKVQLVGEVEAELDKDLDYLSKQLNDKYYFVKVIDNTTVKIDMEKLKYDISLKGEFVKTVLDDSSLTDEDKSRIISLGLKALTKNEL